VPLPDGARLGFPCPLFALADHHARERDTPSSRSARLRRTWPRGPVVALTEQGRLRQRQPQVAHVAFVIDPGGTSRSRQFLTLQNPRMSFFFLGFPCGICREGKDKRNCEFRIMYIM
jgi:hypothetical protein